MNASPLKKTTPKKTDPRKAYLNPDEHHATLKNMINEIIDTTTASAAIPTLESSRLVLRPFKLTDADDVQRMAGSPKVAATTATIPHPYLDGMAEAWIGRHLESFQNGTSVEWAITLKREKLLIGCVSFHINRSDSRAELGYWIGEDFWSQGYCTEAATLARDYAFQKMRLNKITARYLATNVASGRVMQKIGMLQEGNLKQDFFKNGCFHDKIIYGMLNPLK